MALIKSTQISDFVSQTQDFVSHAAASTGADQLCGTTYEQGRSQGVATGANAPAWLSDPHAGR